MKHNKIQKMKSRTLYTWITLLLCVLAVVILIYATWDASLENISNGAPSIAPNTTYPTYPTASSGILPDTGSPTDHSPGSQTPMGSQTPTGTPTPTEPPTPTETPTPPPKASNPNGATSANPAYAGKKIVALTFDDGVSISYTGAMLDMLKDKGVHATFFVCGYELTSSTQKALLLREKQEGHEIGSHSYDHSTFTKLSVAQMREQIENTDALILEATGDVAHLFRPPGGAYNQAVIDTVGKTLVLWDADSNDWDHIHKNTIASYASSHNISTGEAKKILINELLFTGWYKGTTYRPPLIQQIKHGGIILFHDIHEASREAAALLIDYLQASGDYVFMTVSQMIETEGAAPQTGEVYYNMWKKGL